MKRWGVVALIMVGTVLTGAAQEEEKNTAVMEGLWPPKDDMRLVEILRERMEVQRKGAKFDAYKNTFQHVDGKKEALILSYEMIPIKGGRFVMGSQSKGGGHPDERPSHDVKVSSFWMGKFEVTWDLYEPFMITSVARDFNGRPKRFGFDVALADVISKPTTPYTEMSMGMGTEGYPAINMTQHAANKFCQWLSAKTGHFYRLPTEAEWEYACRAGTTGPFHCPESELEDYAVIDPKQVRVGYEKVGTKKPNPWGLYDMHGNVMEWCVDQYDSVVYRLRPNGRDGVTNPIVPPNRRYPRVFRGGSWYDEAKDCRSSARFYSTPDLQIQDPQLPKSYWHLTDADWLGFRIVRPLQLPEAEEIDFFWNSANPERLPKEERHPAVDEFAPAGRE